MTNRILVAAVFLVGCAVGGVSSQLVVPKASAQQAALPAWELLCFSSIDADTLTEKGNKLGVERWEIASDSNGRVCFKRRKM